LNKRRQIKWLNVKVAAVMANVRPVTVQEQILPVSEPVKSAAVRVNCTVCKGSRTQPKAI